jgi:hypothetical protein
MVVFFGSRETNSQLLKTRGCDQWTSRDEREHAIMSREHQAKETIHQVNLPNEKAKVKVSSHSRQPDVKIG